MTDRPKRYAQVTVMAMAAFLLLAASAEAGLLSRLFGVGRVGSAYEKNVGEAVGHLDKAIGATIRGDEEAYRRHAAEVLSTPAKIARDAGPVGRVSDVLGKVASTKSRITKGLEFAKEKIARIFGGGGGNGAAASPDPRAALAVDKASRKEYVARSDIFDRQRLSGRAPVRAWSDENGQGGSNGEVWADAEGGGWNDDTRADAWADDGGGGGRNEDVWAEAEGGGWDDDARGDAWTDDGAGSGPNEDVWAEAEGGGWDDDARADAWADDRSDRGRNEDVWAEAEGGGWDDDAQGDAWADDRSGRGRNEDIWADAEGGGWDDDAQGDAWADDRSGRGRNEDIWADAEGGGWDDGTDAWADDSAQADARQAALSDMRAREAEERERQLAEQQRQAQQREQVRLREEQQQRRQLEARRSGQSGISCDSAQSRLAAALEQIRAKSSNSGASGKYCARANIASAVSWTALRCLEDPVVDAEKRRAFRDLIETERNARRQSLQGFRALTTTGSSCGCWTDICADNFDTGSFEDSGPHVTEYHDPGPSTSERSRDTRVDETEDDPYPQGVICEDGSWARSAGCCHASCGQR